jgi:hypothetical protein
MLGNEAPQLPLLIGAVAAILLGTSGIAAVMAWTPTSIGAQAPPAAERAEGEARVRVKCAECGVVASTREIEQLGAGIDSDSGAAGGVTAGGRNETPEKSAKSYEVTVRMKDGSSRVFMEANPANWRPGERVIFIEGASQSND